MKETLQYQVQISQLLLALKPLFSSRMLEDLPAPIVAK